RSGEYGRAEMEIAPAGAACRLFDGVRRRSTVWMNHGDQVVRVPPGFTVLASSSPCPAAAMADEKRRIYGLQFHPEVMHSEEGTKILGNFLRQICGCEGRWQMTSFLEQATQRIAAQTGGGRIVLGLSGGVDSSVVAVLCHRAVNERVTAILVDTGMVGLGQAKDVVDAFRGDLP